jgi:hypothetical protein
MIILKYKVIFECIPSTYDVINRQPSVHKTERILPHHVYGEIKGLCVKNVLGIEKMTSSLVWL